ncbi:hypothetical protein Tco_1118714 [Tanacetum coccineum]
MAQVLLLQSQKLKLEQQKEKAEAKVAFLKAQPLYPDVNQLTKLLVAELKTLQWELPAEFLGLPSQISSVQENLKTLDALPSLLNKVTDILNRFATSVENETSKAIDKSVPAASQASASPAEGEKNTKNADNANLKQQPTIITPPTTSSFQSPLFPKSKGKEVMSSKDAEDEETESDPENDHANPADYMVESSMQKKLKKFNFVTKGGEQIHLTAEKIEEQKRIEESLKAKLAKQEVEKVKDELVDLMGIDVVTQYYNKKLIYDKYYDIMLKRRKSSKITNCEVSDLHLAEWREGEIVGLESLKNVQLQFFRYLEDQDHLHFSLCGSTETEDKTLARASV